MNGVEELKEGPLMFLSKLNEQHARDMGFDFPAIPVPDPHSGNWPANDRPAQWIDWSFWQKRRGAIWWQVVELSLGLNPMARCIRDLGRGWVGMVSSKLYDLGHPNPIRERLEITEQFRDKLPTMPPLEPPKLGAIFDESLPGKKSPDWAIEWGYFREFAHSRGWNLPEEFPVDAPFDPSTPRAIFPVTEPSTPQAPVTMVPAGAELPNRPKDWGASDAERLRKVREAGLESWVLGELEGGTKKAVIVEELLLKLGEAIQMKSRYQRVVQALTPPDVAAKERCHKGSGR